MLKGSRAHRFLRRQLGARAGRIDAGRGSVAVGMDARTSEPAAGVGEGAGGSSGSGSGMASKRDVAILCCKNSAGVVLLVWLMWSTALVCRSPPYQKGRSKQHSLCRRLLPLADRRHHPAALHSGCNTLPLHTCPQWSRMLTRPCSGRLSKARFLLPFCCCSASC